MLRLATLAALALGCAAVPTPAPVAPSPSGPPSGPQASQPVEPAKKPVRVVPAAVPPPPPECATLVQHLTAGCAPPGTLRASLAAALAKEDAVARDAALACLEPSEGVPVGVLRALRAELGPEVCADALVTPLLETPPKGLGPELESTLLGLMLGARLSRLLDHPPKLEGPTDKQRFQTFFAERLTPWVLSEAAAIEKLSLEAARLTGYGRALGAIAAGNADLRFVEMVREVPLPDEMKADKEVVDAYYGVLDQALEPRKVRGRDAALVGLRAYAELGATGDPRVHRARTLLNKLWSGSRIDALDRLLLPELEAPDASTPELVLAQRLPTFYTQVLLADLDPTDAKTLRALLERGVPAPFRAKLDAARPSDAVRALYARALIERGRKFFRAEDFKHARAVLGDKPSELGRLLGALAQALENGPLDATELMLKGPFVRGTGDVTALDAEAKKRGRFAGFAAFDAAYVLELAPKPDDPAFWDDLAARFTRAEKLLATPARPSAAADVKGAREHADASRSTAAALRGRK